MKTFQTVDDLAAAIRVLNEKARETNLETDIILVIVGGSAVLALSDCANVTRDIDIFKTDSLEKLERKLGQSAWTELLNQQNLSTNAHIFSNYLCEDWQKRCVFHERLSFGSMKVLTPSAEDLAVMKLFRLNSKDAADIQILAALPDFDRHLMKALFLNVLPTAIGRPEWHAQSFEMVWNGLYPSEPITQSEILAEAGF